MKTFTVKKLAELSGVSIRTLHYYDQIGLLKPGIRTEKKYRYYGNDELLRLQQILFYRELDFPLNKIIEMLDNSGYDLVDALNQHKSALLHRKKRISTLLKTIDNTIYNLKKGGDMKNHKELYQGFSKEVGTIYRKEAIEKYGKETVEHSESELMKLGMVGYEALKNELKSISRLLFELSDGNPEADEVQSLVEQHYEVIRKFWGTSKSADKQAEAYAGLGDLYVSEDSYLANVTDGIPKPKFSQFLQKAMRYFAENNLR